jgi:hypothetical protein
MGIVALKGSRIMTGLDTVPQELADPGEANVGLKLWTETVEVGAADSATSTYRMARLPSNARIHGLSRLHHDDLASSGSPTLDIGITNTPGRSDITADPDALNDGIDAAAANGASIAVVKDKVNYGKRLWEYVNGQTVDPKCLLDILVTLADADVNVGGTITLELVYSL